MTHIHLILISNLSAPINICQTINAFVSWSRAFEDTFRNQGTMLPEKRKKENLQFKEQLTRKDILEESETSNILTRKTI